jgi:hypothetical protein
MIDMNVQIMRNVKGNYCNWTFYAVVVTTVHHKHDSLYSTKFQPQINLQGLFRFDKNTACVMEVSFFYGNKWNLQHSLNSCP